MVYFQIGMIIGDTDDHNKISGFRGGNEKYRQSDFIPVEIVQLILVSRIIQAEAKCEPRLVTYIQPYLDWVLNHSNHSDGK